MATQETIKQMRVSENGPLRDLEDTTARAGVSALQSALASLRSALDTLMGTEDITDEIDTYNEIKDFLDGFDVNDPNLSSQLALLNSQVNDLTTAIQNKANTSALNTAVANLQALINGKVDAVNGKGLSTNDYTNEDKAAVATIANKANSADVYTKSQTYDKAEVDTALGGKLGVNDVYAQTPTTPDGTFTIHVGENAYTINLNHTHEGMAKLEKVTEATLPQTLANDTIYVQVNNLNTPTEIESLWLFGLEFTAGVPDVTPRIITPSSNEVINIDTLTNGMLQVRAKNLTQPLTIELSGSDYAFGNTQPTGVTVVSTTELTVTAAAANAGVNIAISYNGSAANAEGELSISSGSPDNISFGCDLIANVRDYDAITAIKFTGTQWMNLGFPVDAQTKIELDIQFVDDSTQASTSSTFFSCEPSDSILLSANQRGNNDACIMFWVNSGYSELDFSGGQNAFARGIMTYYSGFFGYNGKSTTTETLSATKTSFLLGYSSSSQKIYDRFPMVIWGVKVWEGNTLTHNFVPAKKNNVIGLYDTVESEFIAPEAGTLVELQ